MRCAARSPLLLLALALSIAWSQRASAHPLGVSQSDFSLESERSVRAAITFARADAASLLQSEQDVRDLFERGIEVRADSDVCAPEPSARATASDDGVRIEGSFTCGHAPRALDVTLYFLANLPPAHRHLVRISAGAASSQVTLHGEERFASLRAIAPNAHDPSMFLLGAEHIALGWDHLLFLFAVIAAERRARAVLAIVTAFTLAHSMTLTLAALDLVTPSARIVEPLIAASIAYVGFENLARGRLLPRALTTFGFGLLHGFGFASALRAIDLDRARLLPSLFAFNAGVETGQLAIVLASWPLLAWLRRTPRFEVRTLRALSLSVALAGAVLLASRVLA